MKGPITAAIAAIVLLAGCSTARLTVDDGRKLDGQLVNEMRSYGAAAAAMRPAIVRSAALHDKSCSGQYELPFEAMTSYGIDDEDQKIALVRALGVNENLRVIASDPSSGLQTGDVLTRVDDYSGRNSQKMLEALMEARDRGKPFEMTLASGRQVTVSPIEVCRGHVLVASPFQPDAQHYHWTYSMHPLEVFQRPLTRDEAEWIVLWTQGLSETGAARMKSYAFMVGGLKWIVSLGLSAGASSALAAGTSSAGPAAAAQLAGQAGSMATRAAAERATLSGIDRVAAGAFDRADEWAFEHMLQLGMNPRAGLTLHEKLLGQGAEANAFVFNDERLAAMRVLFDRLPEAPHAGGAVAHRSPAH